MSDEQLIIPDNSNAVDSSFKVLSNEDVNKYIKGKNGFRFLSWSHAVNSLLVLYPTATWKVREWNEIPYLQLDGGCFVQVDVTIDNITRGQLHPVLDYRNKPILKPNVFDLNTSIQRGLTKSISLHGLGLYIYQGEDFPVNLRDGLVDELIKLLKANNKYEASHINNINNMNEKQLSEAIERNKENKNEC